MLIISEKEFVPVADLAEQSAYEITHGHIKFVDLTGERHEMGGKTFLNEKLYQHYRVNRMSSKAQRFIRKLFEVYLDKPEQLPPQSQAMLKKDGPHRVICDYIAGMTDRYALNEYKKLFEPFEQV